MIYRSENLKKKVKTFGIMGKYCFSIEVSTVQFRMCPCAMLIERFGQVCSISFG
jgi:hypothetical protein